MRHRKNVSQITFKQRRNNQKSKHGICKFPRWQDSPKSLNYRNSQETLLIRPFIFEALLIISWCNSVVDRAYSRAIRPAFISRFGSTKALLLL